MKSLYGLLVSGIALPIAAAVATFAVATSVAAAEPQTTVDPPNGDCATRPIVQGTGFPPNTPLELDVGDADPSPSQHSQLAVDVEFWSDAAGSFEVKASEEFGRSCLRNRVVKVVIGPDRFPDGHRADLSQVYAIFNGPGVPATGSGTPLSGTGSEWMVRAGVSLRFVCRWRMVSRPTATRLGDGWLFG